MKHLRHRANGIWGIIEDKMCEVYSDVKFQIDNDPCNDELNDIDGVLGVISSSTGRIQRIIESRLSNEDEVLTTFEVDEIKESIEAIIYYLNEKVNYFKRATCYEDLGKIIFTLILCRNIALELYENCDYLKRSTRRFKSEQVI